MKQYIKCGEATLDVKEFIDKVQNYDIEPTRKDIIDAIKKAEEYSPADITAILSAVKNTYHLRMAI